ncbi:MAG: ComEA family DNA-binding protein [Rhodothermales bacterium]
MTWIYRLQQRLAITPSESTAVLVLSTLFLIGLSVQYVQRQAQPFPEATYTETDRLFAEAALRPVLPESTSVLFASSPVRAIEPDGTIVMGQTGVIGQKGARQSRGVPAVTLAVRPINLNQATAAELETLPRIGPKIAERILSYRAAHGPFKRVQDLTDVQGIGEKTLARLEPLVTVTE